MSLTGDPTLLDVLVRSPQRVSAMLLVALVAGFALGLVILIWGLKKGWADLALTIFMVSCVGLAMAVRGGIVFLADYMRVDEDQIAQIVQDHYGMSPKSGHALKYDKPFLAETPDTRSTICVLRHVDGDLRPRQHIRVRLLCGHTSETMTAMTPTEKQ